VYFDYQCPYAWRGAELAAIIAKPLDLTFEWHHFSLWQSNYNPKAGDDPESKLWEHPLDDAALAGEQRGGWGLLPFLVSIAGSAQDASKEEPLRLAIFRSFHQDKKPFDLPTLLHVAADVGLDAGKLEHDLSTSEPRQTLAREHEQAKSHHVFGTPTFHFEAEGENHLAYLRINQLPDSEAEAINLFQDYCKMLTAYPYLQTLKRPRPPA
jgi:predicted DsbA family dithiol-disulfide isomerase